MLTAYRKNPLFAKKGGGIGGEVLWVYSRMFLQAAAGRERSLVADCGMVGDYACAHHHDCGLHAVRNRPAGTRAQEALETTQSRARRVPTSRTFARTRSFSERLTASRMMHAAGVFIFQSPTPARSPDRREFSVRRLCRTVCL